MQCRQSNETICIIDSKTADFEDEKRCSIQIGVIYLEEHVVSIFKGKLFYLEQRGSTLLRNVVSLLLNYTGIPE